MPFVKKTPSEFEALSEYQKEKYLDEKSQHEAYIAKEQAEKSAKEAIEAMKVEFKTERDAELKALEDKNEAALQALADKHQIDIDEMKATLKRAKVGELDERIKGVSEFIVEKLSTEEGENLLKGFFKGRKLEMEVSEKAMLKPAGGVAPQFTTIVGPGHDDFHARDLIPVFPTVSDLITYVQLTTDEDADGIGVVAAGAQKPDMGYISEVKQAAVVKLAGLLDVADEMLTDVVGFRAWLAYELPKALLDAEDLQIYKGSGAAGNILGLWTQADGQTLPFGTVTVSSNPIDQVAAGITEIRTRKRGVNGAVISPIQWMEMYINKDLELAYTYPVVFAPNGTPTILGVPVYWSNVFEENEGIVGDFRYGTAIFQRMAMRIDYSGEHKDNFGKNVITARIEERIALPIYFPEGFLKLFQEGTT